MSSDLINDSYVDVTRTALITSIALHLTLLAAFITAQVLDHYDIHLFSKKDSRLQMFQNYIQVDVVAMPEQLINEKVDTAQPVVDKPATTVEEVKPAVKDDTMEIAEKKAEEERKAKEKEAEKLKQQKQKEEELAQKKLKEKKEKAEEEKALKKLQEEANREAALKALSKAKDGKNGRKLLAGNKISKGTALHGAIGTTKDRYIALVEQAIKEHFKLYAWQKKKGLVAVVYFRLYPTGRVREKKIVKPSFDAGYNAAVLQAIDAAQPLPVPDDKSDLDEGITIEFKPEESK